MARRGAACRNETCAHVCVCVCVCGTHRATIAFPSQPMVISPVAPTPRASAEVTVCVSPLSWKVVPSMGLCSMPLCHAELPYANVELAIVIVLSSFAGMSIFCCEWPTPKRAPTASLRHTRAHAHVHVHVHVESMRRKARHGQMRRMLCGRGVMRT